MLFENMRVPPMRVWSSGLDIHKPVWRVPFNDLSLPTNWYTIDSNSIVDQQADLQWSRLRSQDFKFSPWGSYFPQIARIGEERKHFGPRPR
jgi:hypothetical protein